MDACAWRQAGNAWAWHGWLILISRARHSYPCEIALAYCFNLAQILVCQTECVTGILAQVVALFFVCAFGSSLDVAAIQAESPEPLDFNHELQTVGVHLA